jgi:hypothetical protein
MRRAPDTRFLVTLAAISLINPLAVHMFLPAMPVVKAAFGISDALVGLTFSITLFVMAFVTLEGAQKPTDAPTSIMPSTSADRCSALPRRLRESCAVAAKKTCRSPTRASPMRVP